MLVRNDIWYEGAFRSSIFCLPNITIEPQRKYLFVTSLMIFEMRCVPILLLEDLFSLLVRKKEKTNTVSCMSVENHIFGSHICVFVMFIIIIKLIEMMKWVHQNRVPYMMIEF